jgi:hypothetical protein
MRSPKFWVGFGTGVLLALTAIVVAISPFV